VTRGVRVADPLVPASARAGTMEKAIMVVGMVGIKVSRVIQAGILGG